MKFLKKPIFIKKIRSYNDDIKLNYFSVENSFNFVPKNNIIKSSYLEKVVDLNNLVSNFSLKGGYFYSNKKNLYNKNVYFIFSKSNFIIDPNFLITNKDFNLKLNDNIKIVLLLNYFNIIILKKSSVFLLGSLKKNINKQT